MRGRTERNGDSLRGVEWIRLPLRIVPRLTMRVVSAPQWTRTGCGGFWQAAQSITQFVKTSVPQLMRRRASPPALAADPRRAHMSD